MNRENEDNPPKFNYLNKLYFYFLNKNLFIYLLINLIINQFIIQYLYY
jgi:hypothetical protein